MLMEGGNPANRVVFEAIVRERKQVDTGCSINPGECGALMYRSLHAMAHRAFSFIKS